MLSFSLFLAAGAVGCHHDTNGTPVNAGSIANPGTDPAVSGANGPATAGGASTENSTYGGNTGSGSAPGDRFTSGGVDPATGIARDAGMPDGGAQH